MEVKIKQEFINLIPPPTQVERDGLEASILAEGCRDALVLWNGYIVDGHNRYAICEEHDIDFDTVSREFEDENAAKLWMIDNQNARRNLTDGWRYQLAQARREILLAAGKEKRELNLRQNDTDVSDNDISEAHSTRNEVADSLGWSTGKTAQAQYVWDHADEETKEEVKSGEKSIHKAYEESKKMIRTLEIATDRQELATAGASVPVSDRWNVWQADIETWQAPRQYDWIITDPPYPKEYLPLYSVLAERANEWLKPGGLLIAMAGQSYLDEIYEMMSKHLDYYWTAAYLTPGQPTPLRQRNVNTTWKPLLIFSKGEYKGKIFGDVFESKENDKEHHKWGQSESGMSDIISKICLPGQSILDPFCGAGTTGIAALKHSCFFDGIDNELENVNISKGRLNDC